jgi:hypothetical protein
VKHIFEVRVKELVKIPILDKLIKDGQGYDHGPTHKGRSSSKNKTTPPKKSKMSAGGNNQYIQNVSVKYAFPLDDDEIFESDYLQQTTPNSALDSASTISGGAADDISYVVSMDTVHSYTLNKDDKIQK